MATMWPERLPAEVRSHPYRQSEVKTYDRLRNELDDRYTVYYSRPWLGLTATGEEIDGESDFLIAHAQNGILAVEVKGGGIAYDPKQDTWSSRNRHGVVSTIKNPVQQARSAKHTFIRRLKEVRGLERKFFRARHGVIFPDCDDVPRAALAPDMPARLFCCAREFQRDLAGWVRQRMETNDSADEEKRVEPLGAAGMAGLERMLATPFSLRIPLSGRLRESLDEANVLTMQQAIILRGMEHIRRLALSGPAGSGKTILSIHEALRLAEEGSDVLWLCYNNALAEKMAAVTRAPANLRVLSFHQYCSRAAAHAGITVDNADKTHYFEELLPEAAISAIDADPGLGADAVVVDEGQDFLPLWWTVIDAALEARNEGILRIFHDANQKLYRERVLPADVPAHFHLTRNLRNTRQIFAEARHLHLLPSGKPVEAAGPDGVPVSRTIINEGSDLCAAVAARTIDLIRAEELAPGDVAVLTTDQSQAERIRDLLPYATTTRDDPEAVVVDTVRRFKGLERPAVVLGADEVLAASSELTYVALSRASGMLALVGVAEALEAIKPPAPDPSE